MTSNADSECPKNSVCCRPFFCDLYPLNLIYHLRVTAWNWLELPPQRTLRKTFRQQPLMFWFEIVGCYPNRVLRVSPALLWTYPFYFRNKSVDSEGPWNSCCICRGGWAMSNTKPRSVWSHVQLPQDVATVGIIFRMRHMNLLRLGDRLTQRDEDLWTISLWVHGLLYVWKIYCTEIILVCISIKRLFGYAPSIKLIKFDCISYTSDNTKSAFTN